mgnify:CR=1 FL=1
MTLAPLINAEGWCETFLPIGCQHSNVRATGSQPISPLYLQLSDSGEVGGVNCMKAGHFEAKKNKNLDLSFNCSNFFVFQNYELRFSEIFCLVLIRSFPGSFAKNFIPCGPLWGTTVGIKRIFSKHTISQQY